MHIVVIGMGYPSATLRAGVGIPCAVVCDDVPDYTLMLGVPARRKGWMSRHGSRLHHASGEGIMICPESGWRYTEVELGVLCCLDWPEDEPLREPKMEGAGEQKGEGAKEGGKHCIAC